MRLDHCLGPLGAGVVGMALVACCAPPAQAQIRMSRAGPGAFGSEISKRSLEQYGKVLRLDAAQKEAAEQLHAGYLESMKQVSTEMRESMRSLEEEAADGDASGLMEKMPEVFRKSGERRSAVQKAFLDDLRTLLTPQQEDAWPRLERLRRRESGLRFGQVSGAGVDMIALVDALKLPEEESARLSETLAQYETDLDRLLVEQENEERAQADAHGPGAPRAEFDPQRLRERMDKAREAGVKVRDLNRQYERRLGALLSESHRPLLAAEFKRRAFRQIYRDSTPSRWLTAAEKFDDLDPQQRALLEEIRAAYERDAATLNERWASALEQAENEGKAGLMFMPGGAAESEELKAARKARRELDERMNERIRTALNEKQRERLPKKRPAGDGPGANFFAAGEGGAVMFQSIEIGEGEDGEEGVTAEVHVIAPR